MPVHTLSYPLMLVNFKTYPQSIGSKAVRLAILAEQVSDETGICIAVAPQTVNIQAVSDAVGIPVFAQHIDPISPGRNTGHTLPDALHSAGASGTLISHSEKKLNLEDINSRIQYARKVGLTQVVCVDTVQRGNNVAQFHPDAIAIEPPELIGTGIPVSKAQPEIVSASVKAITSVDYNIKVLCGAGITNGDDVASAIKLGAHGILVASGVVKNEDPLSILRELAEAIL